MSFNQLLVTLIVSQFLVFGTLDRIQKALEKSEFGKAEELILKGYEKEPGNPGIPYYHATLLFTTTYKGYNPDSARLMVARASKLLANASEEMLGDLADEGLQKEQFDKLTTQIRDYLFQKTLDELTLITLQNYRDKYPESIYEDILIYKRDSMVYRGVRQANDEPSYVRFIDEYPTSVFKPEADSLLDAIRYKKLEKNGSLKDYYSFLQTYPLTRWSKEVESYILKVSTASHAPERYVNFIKEAQSLDLKRKAADLLYYIDPEQSINLHPNKDSIYAAHKLSIVELFPVMDRDKFGFYKSEGTQQIPFLYNDVIEDIKCGVSSDDWVYVTSESSGKIISKDNQQILDQVDGYQPLSDGLAMASHSGNWFLYHRNGTKILPYPIQDAEVLDHKWIKVKSNDKWGLFAFSGLPIAEARYDDIYVSGTFWVFEKEGLIGVYTEELIRNEIEDRGLSLEFKFEDIEMVDSTMLIGFRGDRECLMDNDLNFLIPWGQYEIYPDPNGYYLKSGNGYLLYNNTDERIIDRYFPYIESNAGWLALKTEQDWFLIPRHDGLQPSREYDSIKLVNPNSVILYKDEAKKLMFSNGKELDLTEHIVKAFPRHPDFVSLTNEGALGVYDKNGELIFDGKYEEVSFINDTLFKVIKQGKQGIVQTNGAFLLNPVFESMDEKDGLILTLLKGKIGCYDLEYNLLIPPSYESRISKINGHYLAKKDGKYGLINGNEDIILNFAYEGIKAWNDTSYLISNGIYHDVINSREEKLNDSLERLQLLYDQSGHRIYKFVKEGRFGLISNQIGMILKPEFTDILNIGRDNEPLFFADQHLSQAGFHVVSYVNKIGKLIFSKAYRKEEFERILCED